jgi:hypothetical protein
MNNVSHNVGHNVWYIDRQIIIDRIKIFAIIPVYSENKIIIVAKDAQTNDSLKLIINNVTYLTKLHQKEPTKPYNNAVVYACEVPDETINLIRKNGFLKITLKTLNTTKDTLVKHYELPQPEEKYTIVESLKHVFFNPNDPDQILNNIIPWIEYHLNCCGVDQIIMNQSRYFDGTDIDSTHLWKTLLAPYLMENKVLLFFYEDHMNRCSHMDAIQNIMLWLNKNRTEWFATHDMDEYICPTTGKWETDQKQNIRDILRTIPQNINYIQTNMYRTTIPNKPTYLAETLITDRPMTCWHKCIVRTNDVNLLWVHIPTNWKIPINSHPKSPLRINHYMTLERNRTSDGDFKYSDRPTIPYDGLREEHLIVIKNIELKYGTSYQNILKDFKKHIKDSE